jgi:hypothetical protein
MFRRCPVRISALAAFICLPLNKAIVRLPMRVARSLHDGCCGVCKNESVTEPPDRSIRTKLVSIYRSARIREAHLLSWR